MSHSIRLYRSLSWLNQRCKLCWFSLRQSPIYDWFTIDFTANIAGFITCQHSSTCQHSTCQQSPSHCTPIANIRHVNISTSCPTTPRVSINTSCASIPRVNTRISASTSCVESVLLVLTIKYFIANYVVSILFFDSTYRQKNLLPLPFAELILTRLPYCNFWKAVAVQIRIEQ